MEEHSSSTSSISATYCVTGANGYIGSWLVKSLLENGHRVHATVRDPAKFSHLQSLGKFDPARLRIFKADLHEEGSFDEAVDGCDGVFHVAATMKFDVPEGAGDDYVRSKIIEPAVRGTPNVLRGCLRSKKPVKRVVFTSSISTITAKDSDGKWRDFVDENCQTPVRQVRDNKASGWVYAMSKNEAEKAAFEFSQANGIDIVSVIAPTVAGPFLTSTVPSSIRVLLSPITGEIEFFKILSAVNSRMGSIALAHIEDLCRAHMFLMDQTNANGRYLCCAQSCRLSKFLELLARAYPSRPKYEVEDEDIGGPVRPEISSRKLKELGFNYRHGLEEIVHQTVESCLDRGFFPAPHKIGSSCGIRNEAGLSK